ncbi:MAG: methylenetetrahydrofolate reductase [NAD(P)H] [Holosporaceae bacterium]|jgi:methylenetetrahydrofolate reductase (NADPH)|nr:methylenetetrahydrofolate reductase [NAD(P)H] [Holosporaceae bacterium]
MYLSELFQKKKCLFSCEIFPPKKNSEIETVYRTISGLQQLHPDFISVTCGAGGSAVEDNLTVRIASHVKEKYGIEPLAHLTCVNTSRNNLEETIVFLKKNRIENVLALRGDRVDGNTATDFAYAAELISLIKRKGNFYIAAACYPEGHPESSNRTEEIRHLKEKVEAGASHLISQLFFNNENFYAFINEVHTAGVHVPIEAGIMPAVDKRLIEKIVSLCSATLPPKLSRILSRFEKHPSMLFEAGIDYATEQIIDLISSGVQGIHLYTMNNPVVAEKIIHNIGGLLMEVNGRRP